MRELRRRMRGKALIWSIISYIGLMTLFTIVAILVTAPPPGSNASVETLQRLQDTGNNIYLWNTTIQVLLVLIVAPTITAGMTTGEKERKTFDFLRVTTITRWMYVMGCFLSTAFYVGIALLCALPLLSLAFVYGGVSFSDVTRSFFLLLGGSCVLSSFGLYVSSVTERTRTAQSIIVFLIFALLFGGFLLYRIYASVFAGATAQATGAAGVQTIYLFNTAIPQWGVAISALLGLTTIFLLLAARKLFEPEDVRAFSHWQFTVLFGAYLFAGIGLLSGNPMRSEIPELTFLAAGLVLLLAAVMTFAVGRMEVGDEIWHLKRLVPVLRPIDQTVPFLILIGLAWFYGLHSLPESRRPALLVSSILMTSVPLFALLCFFARGATGVTASRRKAGMYSLAAILSLTAFPPIAAALLNVSAPGLGAAWREVSAFSPFGVLIDAFNNPNAYAEGVRAPGIIAFWVYSILAVIAAAVGEVARYRRWKDFDYHYDMPAG